MKTPILSLFALTISAALAIPVQAQGHGHGGGGGIGLSGGGGGHISSPAHAAAPSFHSMPHANFGGGRMTQSGQRFSQVGRYSPSSAAFRQHYINSNGGASFGGLNSTAAEISIAATVSPDFRMEEIARSPLREAKKKAQVRFGVEPVSRRTGEVMSSRSIRPIGIVIGTEAATTTGTAIIAVSLTAPGSSLTSGFILGRIGIRTTTTPRITTRIPTVTIPAMTNPAFTKAKNITIETDRPTNITTRPSPWRRNDLRVKVITGEKSMVSLARRRVTPSCVFKAITACV